MRNAFTYKPQEPIIEATETESTTCSDTADGSLRVLFNRVLQDDEELLITIRRFLLDDNGNILSEISIGREDIRVTKNDLEQGRIYMADNLKSGPYSVSYKTFKSGENITFLDNRQNPTVQSLNTPIDLTVGKTDLLCNGHTNGGIVLEATGGSGDYEYQLNQETWKTFNETNKHTIEALSKGRYIIKVRDSKKCFAKNKN